MPWSDYHPDIRQFAGLIQAAASQRYGAAATSEIVAQAASAAGVPLSFQAFTSLAQLYGTYSRMRSSAEGLTVAQAEAERTGFDQGISGNMIGQAPWSPSLSGPGASQYVLARVAYERPTPTGTVAGIFSHQYHVSELHTVLGLLADVQAQMDESTGETDLQGAVATDLMSLEWVSP